MSKDQIIASQAEQIARLTAQVETLTAGLMEIIRSQDARRTKWREDKRRQRPNVHETNGGHSDGQTVDIPTDIPVDNPPNGFSPGTPVSLTPSKEPPTGSRKVPVLQETVALKDGKERGFSEAETNRHLAAFKNYGDKVGWRSKAGPWKDYNAAFRQWLGNETPSAERPLKVVY